MEIKAVPNFEEIYFSIKEEFKKIIKDDDNLKEQLFEIGSKKKKRILSSNYLKPLSHTKGAKPEAITTKFIIKMLNRIEISEELSIMEVRVNIIIGFE